MWEEVDMAQHACLPLQDGTEEKKTDVCGTRSSFLQHITKPGHKTIYKGGNTTRIIHSLLIWESIPFIYCGHFLTRKWSQNKFTAQLTRSSTLYWRLAVSYGKKPINAFSWMYEAKRVWMVINDWHSQATGPQYLIYFK
jgi:hypothetical protein